MRRQGGIAGLVVALSVLVVGCDLPQYPDGTRQLTPQVGPTGTGASTTTISPDAGVRWRYQAVGGSVGTPVISGEQVIVPVFFGTGGLDPNDANASRVVALGRTTGAPVWETLLGHDSNLHIAATETTVFAQGDDSDLTALDLATGEVRWQAELGGLRNLKGPVTAAGDVYVAGHGFGSADLVAYDGDTGALLWQRTIETIGGGSVRPVVAGDVVYLPGRCQSADASRRGDGSLIWHQPGTCHGGGGAEGAVRNRWLYVNATDGNYNTGAILDTATGRQVGTFRSRFLPVVGASNLILIGQSGTIENWSVDGRTRRWSTSFDGRAPSTSPLATSDTVYTVLDGPTSGRGRGERGQLVGVTVRSGQITHRVDLGPYDMGHVSHQWSLAAGNHVIAVPYGDQLVVIG